MASSCVTLRLLPSHAKMTPTIDTQHTYSSDPATFTAWCTMKVTRIKQMCRRIFKNFSSSVIHGTVEKLGTWERGVEIRAFPYSLLCKKSSILFLSFYLRLIKRIDLWFLIHNKFLLPFLGKTMCSINFQNTQWQIKRLTRWRPCIAEEHSWATHRIHAHAPSVHK